MLNQEITKLEEILNLIKNDKSISNSFIKSVEIISSTFKKNSKLLMCGNGGSAAECQHMCTEYVATLNSKNKRISLPAIALTTDTSFLTAWSNDFEFNSIFQRQIESLGSKNDTLIAYTTSGNSINILNALKISREKEINTILLTGNDGGLCKNFSDISFCIPSNDTMRIQECHTFIGHSICKEVEKNFL